MLRRGTAALAALAILVVPAGAHAAPQPYPAPRGCDAEALADATGGDFCISAVLVTAGGYGFTVTDGHQTRPARISGGSPSTYNSYSWSLGPPTAGQVVALWGTVDPSDPSHTLQVTRWVDRTHGTPSIDGVRNKKHPYRLVSALDIDRGLVPENRMVWSLVVPFAELPQTREIGGDGDVHVQTLNPCPGAGLTTETVPELVGYVDSPYKLPTLPDPTDDAAKAEMGEVPPIGVPIVVLGGVRWDPGYGWYEIHPIRAWHFPTAAEIRWAAAKCAADPITHFNTHSLPFPIPYGFPSCGESPVEGDQLQPVTQTVGFQPCGAICHVDATAIDQPETLGPAGVCKAQGDRPIVTHSQLPANRTLGVPPASGAAGTQSSAAAAEGDSEAESEQFETESLPPQFTSPAYLDTVANAYCNQPLPAAGSRGDPFSSCR
jgi:hypothetical protein